MDNAVRYINKICELYNLSEETKKIMLQHIDKVFRLLGDFAWTEIEAAIDWYYANRSQTKQPRLIELNSWLNGRKKPIQKPVEDTAPVKPNTAIRQIQDCFYLVCKTAHIQGIAGAYGFEYFTVVEKIPAGSHNMIVDGRLITKRWLWEDAVKTAKDQFPDRFAPFKGITFWEECALAYKLGVLKL